MPDANDQGKQEFRSWMSYRDFDQEVRKKRRYVWGDETRQFLNAILRTRHSRESKIPNGSTFWRAQIGIEYHSLYDTEGREYDEVPVGFSEDRMKPLTNHGPEGRVNPAGISVLYVASSVQTAISEVRPWIGSNISVARLEVLRDLIAIDLSLGSGKSAMSCLTWPQVFGDAPIDAKTKERAVWTDVDTAFSRPVTVGESTGGYIATQILSELFRDASYDAIIYGSQCGDGFNMAIFDIEDANVISCTPYRISGIEVKYCEAGNPWVKSDSCSRVRGAKTQQ